MLIVGLLQRIDPRHNGQPLIGTTMIQSLHRCQLHGLRLSNLFAREVSCGSSQQRSNESDGCTNLDAFDRQTGVAFLQQIPAAHRYREDATDNPCRGDRMTEFHHGKRRQSHIEERHHLVAHRIRVELAAHRILHPGIGHENPPGRDGCAESCEPGGGEMESA